MNRLLLLNALLVFGFFCSASVAEVRYSGISVEQSDAQHVYDLEFDNKNRMWVATRSKLLIYDGTSIISTENLFGVTFGAKRLQFDAETQIMNVIAGDYNKIVKINTNTDLVEDIISKKNANETLNGIKKHNGITYVTGERSLFTLNGLTLNLEKRFDVDEYDFIDRFEILNDKTLLLTWGESGIQQYDTASKTLSAYKNYPKGKADNIKIENGYISFSIVCDIYIEHIESSKITHFPPPEDFDCKSVSVGFDSNTLLVNYNHYGLYQIDTTSGEYKKISIDLGFQGLESFSSSVIKIKNDTFFIAVHGFGMILLPTSSLHYEGRSTYRNEEPFAAILDVTMLDDDKIFFATNRGGHVTDLDLNILQSITKEKFPSISSNFVVDVEHKPKSDYVLVIIDRDLYVYNLNTQKIDRLPFTQKFISINDDYGHLLLWTEEGEYLVFDPESLTLIPYENFSDRVLVERQDNSFSFIIKNKESDVKTLNIKTLIPPEWRNPIALEKGEYDIWGKFLTEDVIVFSVKHGLLLINLDEQLNVHSYNFLKLESYIEDISISEDGNYILLTTEAGLVRMNKQTMKVSLIEPDAHGPRQQYWRTKHMWDNQYISVGYGTLGFFDVEKAFPTRQSVEPKFSYAQIESELGIKTQFIKNNTLVINDNEYVTKIVISDGDLTINPYYEYSVTSEGIINRTLEVGKNEFFLPSYPTDNFQIKLSSRSINGDIATSHLTIKHNIPFYKKDRFLDFMRWMLVLSTVLGLLLFFFKYIQNSLLTKKLERINDCFNNTQHPIICINKESIIVESNEAADKLFGIESRSLNQLVKDAESRAKWDSVISEIRTIGFYEGTLSHSFNNKLRVFHCVGKSFDDSNNVLVSLMDFELDESEKAKAIQSHEICRTQLHLTKQESDNIFAFGIIRIAKALSNIESQVEIDDLILKIQNITPSNISVHLLYGRDIGIIIRFDANSQLEGCLIDIGLLMKSCNIKFYAGVITNTAEYETATDMMKSADSNLLALITNNRTNTFRTSVKGVHETIEIDEINLGIKVANLLPVVNLQSGSVEYLTAAHLKSIHSNLVHSSIFVYRSFLEALYNKIIDEGVQGEEFKILVPTPHFLPHLYKSTNCELDLLLSKLAKHVVFNFVIPEYGKQSEIDICGEFARSIDIQCSFRLPKNENRWLSVIANKYSDLVTISVENENEKSLPLSVVDLICLNTSHRGIKLITLDSSQAMASILRQKGIFAMELMYSKEELISMPIKTVVRTNFLATLSDIGIRISR